MGHLGNGHSYTDASLYADREEFLKNLRKLKRETGRSRETYIKHYLASYINPPIPPVWMVAEMMSFGQLSRFYSNLSERALRNRIAQPLGLPETLLVPLIRHVTDIRNICAHHGRLWNRQFLQPPKLAMKPDALARSLDQDATQSPAYLYNGLTMIGYIVRTVCPESNWSTDIQKHIATHPTGDLASMGFPADWASRPIWR